MATAVEVMQNFFKVLKDYSYEDNSTGRDALDKAARAVMPVLEFENLVKALRAGLFEDDEETAGMDSATRLQEVTGIVIGANGDLTVDTGAISGANAGGDVIKDAQSIVPEYGDLSTAVLPTPGSTSQITYTGDDGKSFTFNVKWPDSFTQFVSGRIEDESTGVSERLLDSRFLVDLNAFDSNRAFVEDAVGNEKVAGAFAYGNTTYGEMKNAAPIILKGLNTYWLKESAKIIYDSYGLDFDGKTIEIKFVAGGDYLEALGITYPRNSDGTPANEMVIGVNLATYGKIDPTNPNGLSTTVTILNQGDVYKTQYLDRVVVHEMVHAAMMASGTLKELGMPQFFTEGIADLIQGDDDYNSRQTERLVKLATESDTFVQALSFEDGADTIYSYPAGYMLLRFMAKAASNVSIFVGDESTKNQPIDYDGDAAIITDYDESNVINYNAGFRAAELFNRRSNDLIVFPDAGDDNGLIMHDVRGQTITFSLGNGAANAYAYMAENAGEVDGRTIGGGNSYEVLFGADNVNNVIRAGNGGSYLWGGYWGNDELYGGAGADTFIYDIKGGNDTLHDAESQDTVLLKNTTLSQITSAAFTDNGIKASFSYGGTLNIEGQPTNFVIEKEKVTYTADYQNKTFYQK